MFLKSTQHHFLFTLVIWRPGAGGKLSFICFNHSTKTRKADCLCEAKLTTSKTRSKRKSKFLPCCCFSRGLEARSPPTKQGRACSQLYYRCLHLCLSALRGLSLISSQTRVGRGQRTQRPRSASAIAGALKGFFPPRKEALGQVRVE